MFQFLELSKGRRKTINSFFCGRKWPVPFGTPFFDPQNPPEKNLCRSLHCALSQEMRHIFSGGPISGVLGGGQKVLVRKICVLFRSPIKSVMQALPRAWDGIPNARGASAAGLQNSGGLKGRNSERVSERAPGNLRHRICTALLPLLALST